MGKSRNGRRDSPPIPFASSEVEMPLDLTLPRRVSRLRSTRTAIGGFALMLPLASLWRIARRDLAARIRGLRLLAVCLFLGVATLAAIRSLTRAITSELEVRGQQVLGGGLKLCRPPRAAR